MIPIRFLSLLAYFTYIFIDIIIYVLGSTPWSSGIFYMVGQVIADPSLDLPSLCGVVPRVPILIIECKHHHLLKTAHALMIASSIPPHF
jgi:hypothetical protein